MDTLEMKDIEAAVEGILFASGEPVAVDRICVALNMDRPTVELVLQHLQDYYSYERRGVRLLRMEDSWQLCSAPEYGDQIRKAFEIRKPAKLSQPALEVLTIIAYYQPTTRAYVDQIRGVDSSYTVGLLLDRHLIEECGRLQVPGRPRLYRTTQAFLRAFHLNSLEELPQLPGMEADGQLRGKRRGGAVSIRERQRGRREHDDGGVHHTGHSAVFLPAVTAAYRRAGRLRGRPCGHKRHGDRGAGADTDASQTG